ncbi:hypothetical protein B0I35DRAFT_476690 [Stachybotrys elegans]|uniref:WSC domain-containing protein n=1 Tax=Stachybotrys elegans TaxID=80388 RepID=A0A8K0WUQ2_9HYPO|nr:hypothetical protein B0I35DRAFT_476690 [Stachybotrys elegans]
MKTSVVFSLVLAGVSQVLATPGVPEAPTLVARQANPVVAMRPSQRAMPNVETPQGCFKSNGNMKKFQPDPSKPDINVSTGNCIVRCKEEGFKVMAVHMNDCLCGNNYPYENDRVDDDVCNFNCFQFPEEACGGERPAAWGVYNLGFIDVTYLEERSSTAPPPSSTGGSRSTTAPSSAETTTTSSDGSNGSDGSDDTQDDEGGPNVVAIAAGVVGGVVLVAAVAAGFWFYLRRKRNAEIEEEHRRNAAVNAFISGSKPPSSSGLSISDSRLEPSLAHHRLSDGSIADNQDYSRKILRVINA